MYGMMNTAYIDANKLASVGFNQTEIQNLQYLQNNGAKFTMQALQSYGYNYEQASRLMYGYNICAGKVGVDSKEEKIRHFRKMFGKTYRISIQDLAISNVNVVPRVAVVANIVQSPYTIWNSNQYKGKEALYRVVDVSGQKITIETPRKPQLAYKQTMILPGVLEIKGVKANGNAVIVFDKKVCQLCNRFIIVASLRRPEFHHGMYEMMCFEGTRVYVYAMNMGTKENVKYSGGTQRVYDFGIFPNDIRRKLDIMTKTLYDHLHGVSVEYTPENSEFKIITPQKQIDEDDDLIF